MVDILDAHILYTKFEIMWLNNISQFLDTFIFMYFITHFFDVRKEKYRSTLYILGYGLVWGFISIWVDTISGNDYWKYYAVMVLVPLVYEVLFCKGKLSMKMIMPFYYFMILSFLERTVMSVLPYFTQNGMISYGKYIFFFVLRRYGTKVVLLFISFYLLRHMAKNRERIPVFYWFSMAAICLLANVVSNMTGKIPKMQVKGLNLTISISFVVIFVSVFYMVNMLIDKEEEGRTSLAISQQAQFQKEYNVQVGEMSESLRKFRHDFKQHLFCMDTLLMNKEYDTLHEYLLNLHQMDTEGMQIVQYCPITSLNVILNQKNTMAGKMGILFSAQVVLQEVGRIRQQDLNTVVFNLLDNALEAAARTDKGFVTVDIHNVKAYIHIQVSNSVREDILRTNPGMKTWKRDKEMHGMGLKIVKSIVEQNEGIYEVFGDEYTFTTKVLLLDK